MANRKKLTIKQKIQTHDLHQLLDNCEGTAAMQQIIKDLWQETHLLVNELKRAQRDRRKSGVVINFLGILCLCLLWL